MANIFISTNNAQPANCFDGEEEQLAVLNFLNAINFPEIPLIEVVENVYLILDSLITIPSTVQVNYNEDYLLYHNRTERDLINLFAANQRKEGHQTQRAQDFYKPVFTILLNEDLQNKYSQILEILGFTESQILEKDILEVKLNLLHHCLTPEGAKTPEAIENYSLIKDLIKKVKWGEKTVVEHLAEQTNCFDDDNYIKPLTKLRDALLS